MPASVVETARDDYANRELDCLPFAIAAPEIWEVFLQRLPQVLVEVGELGTALRVPEVAKARLPDLMIRIVEVLVGEVLREVLRLSLRDFGLANESVHPPARVPKEEKLTVRATGVTGRLGQGWPRDGVVGPLPSGLRRAHEAT